MACFPAAALNDQQERVQRFLEEALELAQASGCSKKEAIELVDYVFSRPTGDQNQEIGGVMVTLAGLCSALQIDMDDAGETELNRNWQRLHTIRAKQSRRPTNSPLPQ